MLLLDLPELRALSSSLAPLAGNSHTSSHTRLCTSPAHINKHHANRK